MSAPFPTPDSTPLDASVSPCATPMRQSNTEWFTKEIHPHHAQLTAYLHRAFPAVRDRDDVVQESYLRVWRARLNGPVRQAKSFLFQVARHIALDLLRKNRRSRTDSLGDLATLDVTSEEGSPLDALSQHEKVSLVVAALLDLPEKCRQVFILRKFEGLSLKDVAARLGISEKTVDNHLTRGMKLFEAHLRKKGLDGYLRGEK